MMEQTQSESIAKLAMALSKAQAVITPAKKDSENPFFKSKYADMASVWDAIRKPLADNGLAIIQTTGGTIDIVSIITTLVHESGEWVRGELFLKPVKNDPQGIGSAITYGRRYTVAAITGVVTEDDDGNAASMADQSAPYKKNMASQKQFQPNQPVKKSDYTRCPVGKNKGVLWSGMDFKSLEWWYEKFNSDIADSKKSAYKFDNTYYREAIALELMAREANQAPQQEIRDGEPSNFNEDFE